MRKLTLRKEVLTALTTDDLSAVIGASGALCPTDPCITEPQSVAKCSFSLADAVC